MSQQWNFILYYYEDFRFKCNIPRQLNICSMKLYYSSPIFGKDALTSKNTVSGKNTVINLESVDSIFTINFLERIIQFDILNLLLLWDYHFICYIIFTNKLFFYYKKMVADSKSSFMESSITDRHLLECILYSSLSYKC